MPQPTPEQETDIDAFLDDQLADLGLDPADEDRLRQRIRQLAMDDIRGTGPLARRPRSEAPPPLHVAA